MVPPHRLTSHGAVCSTRLSRLYTWLNENRIGISDFSTDTCVERELPRLEALAAKLDAFRAQCPESYLDELAADLRNVMRRLPSARICTKGRAQ